MVDILQRAPVFISEISKMKTINDYCEYGIDLNLPPVFRYDAQPDVWWMPNRMWAENTLRALCSIIDI